MLRILPLLAAIPLVVSFGIAEGLWTDRWNLSNETALASARLADIPLAVDEWEGQPLEVNERQLEMAEITGHLMRQYVNRRTGSTLSVLIVCGRPGPIAVHTPDICYRGAGFDLAVPQVRQPLAAGPGTDTADFWMAKFQRTGAAVPEQMRVLWSWSATGEWMAPDNPRLKFARRAALYKLYVIRQLPSLNDPLEKDPLTGFMRHFLPKVNECLFSTSKSG